jgi:hypothetical protein
MDERPAEEVEHIPWSQLLEEHRAARPWAVYAAAGVIAAVAIGIVGARILRADGPTADLGVTTSATTSTLPAPVDEVVPPSPAAYSEADLLAVYPLAGDREAAARAEWFVTDYFTRDGEGDDPPTSVEWARALDVEREEPDRLRVTVAFRNVTAAGSGWERGPVRAVAVTVDGGAVAGLPEPAAVTPQSPDGSSPAEGVPADLPPEVEAGLLETAARWGEEPVLVAAEPDGTGGWRGVVEVADGSGHRWRLAVASDG